MSYINKGEMNISEANKMNIPAWEEVAPASPLPPGFEHYRFLKKVEKRSPLEEWRDNKFSNLSDLEEELINQTANWLVDEINEAIERFILKLGKTRENFLLVEWLDAELKRLIGRK